MTEGLCTVILSQFTTGSTSVNKVDFNKWFAVGSEAVMLLVHMVQVCRPSTI